MSMESTGLKNDDLESMRGIAAAAVALHHWNIFPTVVGWFGFQMEFFFYMGVDAFFVLSGFLISNQKYAPTLRSAFAFAIRRMFRTTPVLVFSIAIVLLTVYVAHATGRQGIMAPPYADILYNGFLALLGIYTNFATPGESYLAVVWSLSVEYQFYFFLFAVLLTCRRKIAVTVALVAASVGTIVGAALFAARESTGLEIEFFKYLYGRQIDMIAIGVLLRFAQERFGPLVSQSWGYPLMFIPFIVFPFICAFGGISSGTLRMLSPMIFALAISALDRHDAASMSHRWLVALGNRSYPIYLLHVCCIFQATMILEAVVPASYRYALWFPPAQWAVAATLLLILAHIALHKVESPGIALGRILLGTRFASPKNGQ